MDFVAILVGAFLLWLGWYLAKRFYEVAVMKGHTERKYFWICLWLGLWGYLLVIALPDRSGAEQVVTDELPEL